MEGQLFSPDFSYEKLKEYTMREQPNLLMSEAKRIETRITKHIKEGYKETEITFSYGLSQDSRKLILTQLLERFPGRVLYNYHLGNRMHVNLRELTYFGEHYIITFIAF